MQPTLSDGIEVQGTPTHLIIHLERKTLQQNGIVLKEHGKPIATLIPIVTDEPTPGEHKTTVPERPTEASRFPEFEQEIIAFEQMKPELLKLYSGQAVAIYQGKVVATGKNKMDALRNAEKLMGSIHCYVEWVEPVTPRQVMSPSVFAKR
jgi:hypothetical protein